MDIGKFKASRMRLVFWIVLPPLIFMGVGLSAYALRLQAQWELNRAKLLSGVLPELVKTQKQARDLLVGFQKDEAFSIQSEDDLISYIREVERKSNFTMDSLKVERVSSDSSMSVLTASVEGEGTFETIEKFLGNVVFGQHLLFGSQLEISKGKGIDSTVSEMQKATITFELILLDSLKSIAGEGE